MNKYQESCYYDDPSEAYEVGKNWCVSIPYHELDLIEDVKELAKVRVQDENLDSVVYIASDQTLGMPHEGYIDKLVAGVAFFDGHEQWYDEVRSLAHFDTVVA